PDFAKNNIDSFDPEDICEGPLLDYAREQGNI
ncbi:unnamed protein product, partial [marine sediment metagenome]